MADQPQEVSINDCFYLPPEEAGKCMQYKGRYDGGWQPVSQSDRIFRPEVYWWLRENVGYDVSEVWDTYRAFYPNEELPEIPKIGTAAAWLAAGRVRFETKYEKVADTGEVLKDYVEANRYSHWRGEKVFFYKVAHADAFRKRFGLWIDNFNFVARFLRPQRETSDLIAQIEQPITHVALFEFEDTSLSSWADQQELCDWLNSRGFRASGQAYYSGRNRVVIAPVTSKAELMKLQLAGPAVSKVLS